MHDHPRPTAPPVVALQRVRQVAKALAAHGAAGVPSNPDARKASGALRGGCTQVEFRLDNKGRVRLLHGESGVYKSRLT